MSTNLDKLSEKTLNNILNTKINIFNMTESYVDGEGIRMAIFEQGCKHNCLGCHNPDTHNFNVNKEYTVRDIIDILNKNPLLDGITLSGGDPFFQATENINLIKAIRHYLPNLNIWAYTGFTWEQFMQFRNNEYNGNIEITKDMIKMLKMLDYVVDGRFVLKLRTLEIPYKGSSNQRIINVKKSWNKDKPIVVDFN